MADNYLERHYEDYEKRKAQWLKSKKAGGVAHRNVSSHATTGNSAHLISSAVGAAARHSDGDGRRQ